MMIVYPMIFGGNMLVVKISFQVKKVVCHPYVFKGVYVYAVYDEMLLCNKHVTKQIELFET